MEASVARNNTFRGFFLLLCAAVSLAICLESARAPQHGFAWQGALCVRGVFGGIIALAIAWPNRKYFVYFHWKLILRSLLLTFYTIWMFYAVTKITSADVTTITSTEPLWIAILSMVFLKKKYSWLFWIAGSIVVVGMALLVDAKPPEAYSVIVILLLFTVMRAISIMMIRSMMEIPATVIAYHYAIVVGIFGVVIFFVEGGHQHLDVVFDGTGTVLLLVVAATASIYQALVAKVVQILGSISGTVGIMIATVIVYFLGVGKAGYSFNTVHILGLILIIVPTLWIICSKQVAR